MYRSIQHVSAGSAVWVALCALPALAISPVSWAELTGTWQHEVAFNSSQGEAQKSESQLKLEWNQDILDSYLTVIGQLRYDSLSRLQQSDQRADSFSTLNGPSWQHSHAELALREFYLDTEWQGAQWRIGKQQVVWGEADGLKVLDQINPQDFREFILDDFDDSRIATWMINGEFALTDDSSLQVLWIPDTSYHRMPDSGTDFSFTQPARVPQLPDGFTLSMRESDVPDNPLADSELGLRYTAFVSGWDITLNYLYHYNDFAVLYQQLDGNTVTVTPSYERSHLLGGTLSNAFGDLTLRAEVGLNSDSYFVSNNLAQRGIANSPELSSVIGVDWHGFSDTLLSAQWFQSHLLDYDDDIVRDRNESTLSLLYERTFANETWTFKTLALRSLNDGDGVIRPQLSYNLESNLNVWLGADIFYGSEQGLYGQFKDNDRVLIGIEFGF